MLKMYVYFKNLFVTRKGQGMVEYGLIIGLIAVALIAGLIALRGQLGTIFEKIGTALAGTSAPAGT